MNELQSFFPIGYTLEFATVWSLVGLELWITEAELQIINYFSKIDIEILQRFFKIVNNTK